MQNQEQKKRNQGQQKPKPVFDVIDGAEDWDGYKDINDLLKHSIEVIVVSDESESESESEDEEIVDRVADLNPKNFQDMTLGSGVWTNNNGEYGLYVQEGWVVQFKILKRTRIEEVTKSKKKK